HRRGGPPGKRVTGVRRVSKPRLSHSDRTNALGRQIRAGDADLAGKDANVNGEVRERFTGKRELDAFGFLLAQFFVDVVNIEIEVGFLELEYARDDLEIGRQDITGATIDLPRLGGRQHGAAVLRSVGRDTRTFESLRVARIEGQS